MAKKSKTVFVCQECGYESPKWLGQCICGAWNSFVEEVAVVEKSDDRRSRSLSVGGADGKPHPSRLCDIKSGAFDRLDTGIGELNRVLGGGLVKGSLTLISGEPGIGKSTLIIQAAAKLAEKYGRALYVTGEESEEQVKMRADRVCGNSSVLENLYLLSETNMSNVLAAVENIKPAFIVIDSIQTMYMDELDSAPGSVSQVRACGNELMRIGKVLNIPVFIVAHVTKSGDLAGPKIVEHLVDCVLNFTGERSQELRILRSHKNRFGTTSEIGAFEMTESGLLQVENLSKSLVDDMAEATEGSVTSAVYEGTRPLLLEIQALTSTCNVGFARRTALGVDTARLNMLLAVLEKKAGLSTVNKDVYANVVGGLKPEGTSTDLAVALAVYSSCREICIDRNMLVLGEVGLTGELRSVRNADKIVGEAQRLGYTSVLLPYKNAERLGNLKNIRIIGVRNIKEAIAAVKQ